MLTRRETAGIIYGLFRLLRLKTDGIDYMDTSRKGFAKSFFAAVFVFPIYLLQISFIYEKQSIDFDNLNFLILHLVSYIIGWTLWPVIMIYLVRKIDAEKCFFRYVVSYNWLRLLENIVIIPILISFMAQNSNFIILCGVVVSLFFVFYEWFITKTALKTTPAVAASIVFLNILVHALFNDIVSAMS
ncbi:MAG: hypothetical protein KAJ75_01495 [Alphaproteobacteria bacterium]|nr:hypothetical protein [Alphaproteobacteria bacterium]